MRICRGTTWTWNAGFDNPKATNAVFTATDTQGSASSTKARHCCWPSMPTWSILGRSQRRIYGPTALPLPQSVSARPCGAAQLCGRRAPRNAVLCYLQNWSAGIWMTISFLADCCFFYQLVLVALVWLCLMLQWAWPSAHAAVCPPAPEPTPPRPKRRREPTPFVGFTHKPHCDACEHATDPQAQAPTAPPPRIVPTRGRRRQVDTSTHFCPNPDCAYRGWVGWGNLRANGHPNGGPWRQLLCIVCRRYFLETLGTIFHGKRTSPDLIVRVIGCLAEGLGIRGTARVFEVDPNTVLQWLVEAAEQLQAFVRHFLHDIHVNQVQALVQYDGN